jgi:hypothetical protein
MSVVVSLLEWVRNQIQFYSCVGLSTYEEHNIKHAIPSKPILLKIYELKPKLGK